MARPSIWRRLWVKWAAGGVLLALGLTAAMVEIGLRQTEPFLRARLVKELEDHFHARVELDSFHVSLVKGLWAEGKGLRIWQPADSKDPEAASVGGPLIRVAEFRFHAKLHYRPGEPIRIPLVELKGLLIDLPPRSHFEGLPAAWNAESEGEPKARIARLVNFQLDRIDCTGGELVMETSKPGKLPLEFRFAHVNLSGIAAGRPVGFDAELTNPRPKGTIKTTGTIDAFRAVDFGASPIEGGYTFEHADLSCFKGIAGTLSSTGHYAGTLRDLAVDGETETPDFRLTHLGNPLPLTVRFHARVDGTNGDTWLDPLDATLNHSHFTAAGEIVRVMASDADGGSHGIGHRIDLKINVNREPIEDFLRLTSHSDPVFLNGDVTANSSLEILPGPSPVIERVRMDGWFSLDNTVFTSQTAQGRIADLSLRGQGRPDDLKSTDPASIRSRMQSRFTVEHAVITLPALDYTVPGAEIGLKGTYALEGGALNFDGSARMDASVSKMVGGWKGVLLTPVDPLFKKDGAGTRIPIHVAGTRKAPEFEIEFGRLKIEKKPGKKE